MTQKTDRVNLIKECRKIIDKANKKPHLYGEETVVNAKKLLKKLVGQELTEL